MGYDYAQLGDYFYSTAEQKPNLTFPNLVHVFSTFPMPSRICQRTPDFKATLTANAFEYCTRTHLNI